MARPYESLSTASVTSESSFKCSGRVARTCSVKTIIRRAGTRSNLRRGARLTRSSTSSRAAPFEPRRAPSELQRRRTRPSAPTRKRSAKPVCWSVRRRRPRRRAARRRAPRAPRRRVSGAGNGSRNRVRRAPGGHHVGAREAGRRRGDEAAVNVQLDLDARARVAADPRPSPRPRPLGVTSPKPRKCGGKRRVRATPRTRPPPASRRRARRRPAAKQFEI